MIDWIPMTEEEHKNLKIGEEYLITFASYGMTPADTKYFTGIGTFDKCEYDKDYIFREVSFDFHVSLCEVVAYTPINTYIPK